MPCVRTYHCEDCGTTFDHWHQSSDEGAPACPGCVVLSKPKKRGRPRKNSGQSGVQWVPQRVNMTGNKSRALDLAQQIAEEDYGLTNMKDNLRIGDTAAMMPVPSTADREREEKSRAEVAQYMADQAKAAGVPVADDTANAANLATNPQIVAQRNAFFGGGMNQANPSSANAPRIDPSAAAQLAIQSNPSGITRAQTGHTSMETLHKTMKTKYGNRRLPFDAKIIARG